MKDDDFDVIFRAVTPIFSKNFVKSIKREASIQIYLEPFDERTNK